MSEKVVVVGGGLAGLSAAARLAHYGYEVTLLEKAPKLGGRAITIPLKGFNFNFGAHAIYARDKSVLRKFESEIHLHVDWKDFSASKAFYDMGSYTTPMPATLEGLYRTKILDSQNKLRFAYEVFKTMASIERGEDGVPIGEYLQKEPEQVRDLLLTVASSNFFTNEPEKIPSPLFFEYYKRLFSTHRAVSYIGGGWQAIVNSFAEIIEKNGGKIVPKEKVTGLDWNGNRITAVHGKEQTYEADTFIFCIPPKELCNLFSDTPQQKYFDEYSRYAATQVVVYDVGLKERIASPFTYVYQKAQRVFITDISYYDTTCVPEGGQLMQAVAYLNEEEIANGKADEKIGIIETVYDKHFPGWRDRLVAKRVSKKATVQEIKCIDDQRLMPVKFYSLPNAYFAGDWCQGEGQLSELSFSSAYEVTSRIIKHPIEEA
ncbi:phytoene desaturase family protein [Paenactinomyces guangxiensis]|uniref:NAD(P)/FAD-dependent oxidoreductase n=1 Tax=Paenactinomyces guangxiensis TaxID=1490290 RepID=A0A7W1WNN1_9BACL|nr:FAD-dependent oxidoreductase [Paenactinomyces guangxiensis]MBA4493108.1 NAD(P)/FAD-dependent oxidoreductase [Paenactinomyces guangxiensis]MBH8590042.1 NAD(P)/FAD-dependent oxidoreductase [Paenactinomyces guangxiensis]